MIISVSAQKGGVGKTTTADALISILKDKGFKVLGVDLDPQMNLSMINGTVGKKNHSIYEVLTGKIDPDQALIETETGDFLGGSNGLVLISQGKIEPEALRKGLDQIKDQYDFIVIDCPPQLGDLTINGLTASDWVIIPMACDIFSINGLYDLIDTFNAVKEKCNPALDVAGVLLARHNKRTVLSKQLEGNLRDQVSKDLGINVFQTTIRDSVTVREAQALADHLISYAPRSQVTSDYKTFVGELLAIIK